jgi:hypothetical protein
MQILLSGFQKLLQYFSILRGVIQKMLRKLEAEGTLPVLYVGGRSAVTGSTV